MYKVIYNNNNNRVNAMSLIDTHLSIEEIQDFKPDYTHKHLFGFQDQPLGVSIFLNKIPKIESLCILEFCKAPKLRGSHYHNKRTEYLYIFKGNIVGCFWDPSKPEDQHKQTLSEGDFLTIKPGLAHAFFAFEDCTAIELSDQHFDVNDFNMVDSPFELHDVQEAA